MNTERLILKNLIQNEDYARKVLPYLQIEYFQSKADRTLFDVVKSFILTYNTQPTEASLLVDLKKVKMHEDTEKEIIESINSLGTKDTEINQEWLLKTTEEFFQKRALHNAIMKSIDIIGGNSKESEGIIPQLLSDALSVSLDPNIGHDYLEDYSERFEYYHRVFEKIPFDLDFFNKITKGGIQKKTLNIILAGTGVGKSLLMCHVSAAALLQGRNVLYITMELSEHEVARRIDANMMDCTFDELMVLSKEAFTKKANKVIQKTNGKLIIKEYPTAGASTLQFKALLNELKIKKNFVPDIIVVDYLNICTSARIKPGNGTNSYEYVKSIAQELRGMAVEYNVPVLSATQTNRAGFVSTDIGLEDTSESFGLPAIADLMIALMRSEILDNLGQIEVKQLKNRYSDPSINRKFIIGVDRAKMKCFDVESSAQVGIADSGQVNTPQVSKQKGSNNKFKGLVVS